MGTGYGLLYKNCPVNARGYSTGGVAIAYCKTDLNLKVVDLPDNDYEMLFTVGSMPCFSRIFWQFVSISRLACLSLLLVLLLST